jgi:hypothetical protein
MEVILGFFMIIIVTGILYFGKKKFIPENLKESFLLRFPGAKNIDWNTNEQQFEIYFIQNDQEKRAIYNSNFVWKETKTNLSFELLPAEVINLVNSKFKNCRYNDVSFIENAQSENCYKIVILHEEVNILVKVNEKFELLQIRNLTQDKLLYNHISYENLWVKDDF